MKHAIFSIFLVAGLSLHNASAQLTEKDRETMKQVYQAAIEVPVSQFANLSELDFCVDYGKTPSSWRIGSFALDNKLTFTKTMPFDDPTGIGWKSTILGNPTLIERDRALHMFYRAYPRKESQSTRLGHAVYTPQKGWVDLSGPPTLYSTEPDEINSVEDPKIYQAGDTYCSGVPQVNLLSNENRSVPNLALHAKPTATLTVDVNRPLHKMAGGIGASWHAIRVEFQPGSNARFKYGVRESCPQGSAVGANPPLDSTAWKDIDRLGKWLGLDWLRVELDRRMYEPQKGKFDWDNEEMRTLYRILDWCQQNNADVFLTEMWRDVDWMAYPDVHPLLSAPNSLDDFAEGLAVLADHLIRKKHYTCVKWLCLANEPPGAGWGYWWSRGPDNAPLTPAFKAVREALDRRGIALPISGPDWTSVSMLEPAKLDFAPFLGAFDIHSYDAPTPDSARLVEDWAKWAHQQGKPFFLTELGDMSLGWGSNNPGPKSFEAVLSNAEKILRGLNAGVDAFNRWSFVNRGDQDGQWQLVRTWDMAAKAYMTHAEPEPVPFYGYAMLTRFTAKHSEVLPCEWQFKTTNGTPPRVFAAALRSPQGRLTLILANRETEILNTHIRWQGLDRETVLYRYEVTEPKVKEPGFKLAAESHHTISAQNQEFSHVLPARSIAVFTRYDLAADDPGMISESSP